jgi:hypothetical protein
LNFREKFSAHETGAGTELPISQRFDYPSPSAKIFRLNAAALLRIRVSSTIVTNHSRVKPIFSSVPIPDLMLAVQLGRRKAAIAYLLVALVLFEIRDKAAQPSIRGI